MHPSNGNLFSLITLSILSSILSIFIFLTCAKPRKPLKESNTRSQIYKNQQTGRQTATLTLTTTENTRDRGSAPSATGSGTPQPTGKKHVSTKTNKKAIKSTTSKHKKGLKSKKEKSKEEKTKKESTFKKFFKFGASSKDKSKSKSVSEEEGGGNDGKSVEENENMPFSSRKARKRKTLGDGVKTAEDNENKTQVEEEPKVVDPQKVIQMGNLDIITQQEKNRRTKEIEQMPSGNYCEEPTQNSKSIKKENLHVKIVETNCKLYETNAEAMTKSLKESMRKRKKIKHQLRPRSKGSM